MRKLFVATTIACVTGLIAVAPASAGGGNLKKFCKTNVAITKQFNSEEPNFKKVNQLIDTAIETAPPAIADAVDAAGPPIQDDPQAAFDDPAVQEAVAEIDQFVLDECGYEVVDVTMADYSFTGIPDEIEKGTVAFNVANEGTEEHVMVVFRFKGDETLDEILELSEEEAMERVTIVGEGFASPGESTVAYIQFKKTGRYAAICPIPVGTTADAEGTGPPHFVEGMATEFEVTS